jgi:hypothetical protein
VFVSNTAELIPFLEIDLLLYDMILGIEGFFAKTALLRMETLHS